MYYIYYWLNLDKNFEVVYIGKGKNNRYKCKNRNIYFNRMIEKYNLKPFIMINNLSEEEAFRLEKIHIEYWKNKNQTKTNLHEGGFGGDVFKYNPDGKLKMIEKCRRASSGKNNPMYGKNIFDNMSEERKNQVKKKMSSSLIKRYSDKNERLKTSKKSKEVWSREGIKEKYRNQNSRRIYMYDLNGNYLKTFIFLWDALNFLGIKSHTTLLKNMKNKKPYKNYYWIRENEKGVETIEKERNYFHLVE